jgi:hypothetical protein
MEARDRDLLRRMPLSEAVLVLFRWMAAPELLDDLFERLRGRCYEKVLSFTVLVQLVHDALMLYHGSGRQSFERAAESDELSVSIQAIYGKLRRVPIDLSMGLLAECTDRLREVFPPPESRSVPKSLRRFQVIVIDGKAVKNLAKRLKPLRHQRGGVLGGRALVALEFSSGLAISMHAHPDGDANDAKFVPQLLPAVRQRIGGARLWLGDRQYCDLTQPQRFSEEGDHFLLRYNKKVHFHADPQRRPVQGRDALGRRYEESWGWIGGAKDPRRRAVRRIVLKRPGEEDVVLLTDLLDAKKYPAADLLTLYLERWGIERMFQQVTEVFHLDALISSSPEATLFQFALCLLIYNLLQTVRAYVACAAGQPRATISTEKLFVDVERELTACTVLWEPQPLAAFFDRDWKASKVRSHVTRLLKNVWTDRWIKAVSYKRRPHPHTPRRAVHGSAYRILKQTKALHQRGSPI